MTEPCNEQSNVRYFCTAGNGMETFLVDEVKRKLAAQNIVQLQGKVIFSSSASVSSICNLKSAERLFLLLKHDTPLKLPVHMNQAKAASVLQTKLVPHSDMSRAAVTWNRLQWALKHRAAHFVHVPKTTEAAKRRREDEGQSLLPLDKSDEQAQNISEQRGDDDDVTQSRVTQELGCKRKRHENQCVYPQSTLLPSLDQISFRISCKCSGSVARYFNTQDVGKILGASLTTSLGWKVDLKNPLIEVNVNLTDDYSLLGIPLTKSPLSNRSYIKNTGLRSTVAWAMASLAQIQPGYFVVDPMCGVGTILIEAAQEHSESHFLGIDLDDEQLVKASDNVVYAHIEDRMQVLKASSLRLPLHSASVDAIVCDFPFGHKYGTKVEAAINLPLVLAEMARVLRVGGALVLLLSPQLACLVKNVLKQDDAKQSHPREEKRPQTEKEDSPSVTTSCAKQSFSQNPNDGTVSERLKGQNCTNSLSHLRYESSLRVGLGTIDGLIHKYVKSDV